MENLLFKTNEGIAIKNLQYGLTTYTQAHCQCTLTDDGFRIYRTPNKTVSADGQVMWGGLVLKPNSEFSMQQGHTYIIAFHVKGKTSKSVSDIVWSNQVGWGGGGLTPSPTNIEMYNPVSSNFNGEGDFWYKFTCNDAIYKTCTESYSGFVAGNTYLSYAGFKFGFPYESTGEMGTDLYITNIRMYDITDNPNFDITKEGIIKGQLVEGPDVKIMKTKDLITNNFIEI